MLFYVRTSFETASARNTSKSFRVFSRLIAAFSVAKLRFSEQKTKIFLSFFEREYLRAVFTAQSYDKFPNPPKFGGKISVCLSMSKNARGEWRAKLA